MKVFQYNGHYNRDQYRFFISTDNNDLSWLKENRELTIAPGWYSTILLSNVYKEITYEIKQHNR